MTNEGGALSPLRLNLGCGRNRIQGWVNIDRIASEGVDLVADITYPLPFSDDSVDEILLSHVLEHIWDALGLMQELHRIAKPDASLKIAVPYGSSDDAWEDQTHVKPYFVKSFGAFAQPYYWRASYEYSGDWQAEEIALVIAERFRGQRPEEIMAAVNRERNVVSEMMAKLVAIKPAREQSMALMTQPKITLLFE
ncbi:MAG: methyltransferase domain-containing protein [Methylocystis sp.]